MLAARAYRNADLWIGTIESAIAEMVEDPNLLQCVLAGQSFLAWSIVHAEAVMELGEEASSEDLDQEVFRRLEILFRNMTDAGLTIA